MLAGYEDANVVPHERKVAARPDGAIHFGFAFTGRRTQSSLSGRAGLQASAEAIGESGTDYDDDLRKVIATLPDRQRAAVVLRYFDDLSDADIAVALGCRVPAVKSLLHRALKELREVVER